METMYRNLVENGNFPEFVFFRSPLDEDDKKSMYVNGSVFHVPTGRIIFIAIRKYLRIEGELLTYKFKQHFPDGRSEEMTAVMLSRDNEIWVTTDEAKELKHDIIKRAAMFFCEEVYKFLEREE